MQKWSLVKSTVVRNSSVLASTQFARFHIRFEVFLWDFGLHDSVSGWLIQPHISCHFIYVRNAWCFQRNIERQLLRSMRSHSKRVRAFIEQYLLSRGISIYKMVRRVEVRAFTAYSWVKFIFQFYLSILLTRRTRDVCSMFMGDIYFSRKCFRLFDGTRCVRRVVEHGYENVAQSVAPPSSNRTRTGADVSVRGTETLCTLITDM